MSTNSNDQANQVNVTTSNKFEEPSDKRNDLIDSGVGFVVSFGFFMTVFVIMLVFGVIRDLS